MEQCWKFRYTLEISLYSENFVCSEILCFTVLCLILLRFGFSPFYSHCNFVVSYFFVISLFLSIYKPHSVTNGHQSLMQ